MGQLVLNIDRFIMEWNSRWPMDKYVRAKYNIPFGSPLHRSLNFIDMTIEYREDQVLKAEADKQADFRESEELKGILLPEFFNQQNQVVKLSKKDIEDEFDKLDVSQFNKPTQ